jgi:hypothetical protein
MATYEPQEWLWAPRARSSGLGQHYGWENANKMGGMARKIHAPLRQFDAFATGEPEILGIHHRIDRLVRTRRGQADKIRQNVQRGRARHSLRVAPCEKNYVKMGI